MKKICLVITSLVLALGCTSTAPHVERVAPASKPLRLTGARIAVLPFSSAPGQPDTGTLAQSLTVRALADGRNTTLVSPTKVEAYLKDHPLVPSEQDREAVEALATTVGADVVLWGSVNQFTPYKFDRLMPATPPYVDLTVTGLRVGVSGTAQATGRKQGSVPATTWSRQPTFGDVAAELIPELLKALG